MKSSLLSAVGVVVVMGSMLIGCSGGGDGGDTSSSATPDEAIKAYIEALNASDIETALSYVIDLDLGDDVAVSSDNTVKPDDIEIAAPKAVETEVEDGAEAADLTYSFDGEQRDIRFTRDEDGWKLDEPLFIYQPSYGDSNQMLLARMREDDVDFDEVDGVDLFGAEFVVFYGEDDHEYSADFEFPGNAITGPGTFATTATFGIDSDDALTVWAEPVEAADGSTAVDITQELFDDVLAKAQAEGVTESGNLTFQVESYPTRDDCEPVDADIALLETGWDELSLRCVGGTGTATTDKDLYDAGVQSWTAGETKKVSFSLSATIHSPKEFDTNVSVVTD